MSEPAASNSANLMLDEPPLIVRMRGLVGFIDHTCFMPQSEQGHFRAHRCCLRRS
ncbi:MAG: hypothetical protein ABI409_14895 [Ramlibacter sp.]